MIRLPALMTALLASLVAVPLVAQPYDAGFGTRVTPQAGAGDPRLQTILYDPDAVHALEVEPGMLLTLIFGAGEEIRSVAVGDSEAWRVTPSGDGDVLFIAAGEGAPMTNMTVISDRRLYVFELRSGGFNQGYVVRMVYPSIETGAAAMEDQRTPLAPSEYRLRGDRDIRPLEAYDNGSRTFIRWRDHQALPAVFGIGDSGEETVLNGQMRDGWYVIDHLYPKLIFRLGDDKATAYRRGKIE